MSGEFRPEQNTSIEATDDPELAQAHGLTEWDDDRRQWVAPKQRDGADDTPTDDTPAEQTLVGEHGPEVTELPQRTSIRRRDRNAGNSE